MVLRNVINENYNCSPFVGPAAIRKCKWLEIVDDRGQQERRNSEANRESLKRPAVIIRAKIGGCIVALSGRCIEG